MALRRAPLDVDDCKHGYFDGGVHYNWADVVRW